MSNMFIFLSMIFFHILDDFKLQAGVLVNLKQRSYWEKNAPDPMYSKDYIISLFIHGLSWAFMTMLPVAIKQQFTVGWEFFVIMVIQAVIHAVIDDLKANRHKINLIVDQTIHFIQICLAFLILMNIYSR